MRVEPRFSDNIILSDIFIGLSDGEKEALEKNFEKSFYEINSRYTSLIKNRKKFIISGRKGTGKTYLSKYIEKILKGEGYQCNTIKLSNFNLQKLIDINNREVKNEEMASFWKWEIYIEIARLVLKNKPSIYNFKEFSNYKSLKGFYNKIYRLDDLRNSQITKSVSGKVSVPASEAAYTLSKSLSKSEYFQVIDKLENILKENLKFNKILLVYDDLDELEYNIKQDKKYIYNLLNLLNVCNQINLELGQKDGLNIRVIIVVREDILEILHGYSNNLNKIVCDSEVNLFWGVQKSKEIWNHPLINSILLKVKENIEEFKEYDSEKLYKRLFPFDKIDKKSLLEYLLEYSFGRPRDIVNYLNIIKEMFPEEKFFKPEFFRKSRYKYSINLYNEVKNELSSYLESKELEEYFLLLKGLKKIVFSYEEISEYYISNKDKYSEIKSLDDYLNFMYKFGILGISKNVGDRKYKVNWVYRSEGGSNPSMRENFIVHYGLRKGLGL